MTEAQLVQQIKEGLEWQGCTVLRVGQHRADKAGSDCGVPDLLVRRSEWPYGVWLGVEVKLPTGRLSAAQEALQQAGAIVVARSLEDAQRFVSWLDEHFDEDCT